MKLKLLSIPTIIIIITSISTIVIAASNTCSLTASSFCMIPSLSTTKFISRIITPKSTTTLPLFPLSRYHCLLRNQQPITTNVSRLLASSSATTSPIITTTTVSLISRRRSNNHTILTMSSSSLMNSREESDEESMQKDGQRQQHDDDNIAAVGQSTFPTTTTTSTPSSSSTTSYRAANNNNNTNTDKSWKALIDISIAKSRKIRESNYVQLSTVDGRTCEPRCRTVVFRGFVKGSTTIPSSSSSSLPPLPTLSGDDEFGGGCVMKMITDARSSKVNEIMMLCTRRNANEWGGVKKEEEEEEETKEIRNTAEMVWWFPKSSEQYRVRGQIQFIGSDGPLHHANVYEEEDSVVKTFLLNQRMQQWGNLSDMAREQFYWDNPGEPFVVEPPDSTLSSSSRRAIPAGGRGDDGKVLPPPDTFLLMLLHPTRVDYLRLSDNYHRVDELKRRGGVGYSSSRWEAKRVNP